MKRWGFFLALDKEHDLSDVGRGCQYGLFGLRGGEPMIERFGWCMRLAAVALTTPTKKDAAQWARAVNALRSVAGRVAGYRGRKPEITATEADEVMAHYISMTEPKVVIGEKPVRKIRLQYVPRPSAHERAHAAIFSDKDSAFAAAADIYFQHIFASLIQPDGVCGDCGRELGATTRAKRCASCKAKRYWDSLPIEKRRERQREKKRRQRAKQKSPTKKK
jgi:hypothetical protein